MPNELDVPDLPEGVTSLSIKEQKVFDGLRFPLILTPAEAFKDKDSNFWTDWVRTNIKAIEALVLKYGAILYREFPFDAPKDFGEFATAYGYDLFTEAKGIGVRTHVVENVYTATESAPEALIPLHHEMGHLRDNPHVVFFYCDLPAKDGGETPLALSNVIYSKMVERDPDLVDRVEREGLRYVRIAPGEDDLSTSYGRRWQSTFHTSNKEEAEQRATDSGYDYEWLPDGSMKLTTETLRSVRLDRRTGKKMWFNSAFTYETVMRNTPGARQQVRVIFPNGDTISDEMLETMKEVMDEARVTFQWKRRDVVLIDNRTVQHSRNENFIPPRRIMACLYKDHYGPI